MQTSEYLYLYSIAILADYFEYEQEKSIKYVIRRRLKCDTKCCCLRTVVSSAVVFNAEITKVSMQI